MNQSVFHGFMSLAGKGLLLGFPRPGLQVMDVTNSASYIVRAILQIRSAALACPQPRACAINIMILGSNLVPS